jgi:beta-hydroxylase
MFYNPAYFDFVKLLEANWLKIRAEVERLQGENFNPWYEKHLYNKDWTAFGLYNGYKQERGQRIEENCALCPETTRIIEAIPGLMTAGFSCLAPGTYIRPHKGYEGNVLRCHLGLIVPEGCGITVQGKTKTWTEGKCIVFDDTFVHEAWNFGKSKRIVLLMDIKKDKDVLGIDLSDEKYIEPFTWGEILRREFQYTRLFYYKVTTKLAKMKQALKGSGEKPYKSAA